MTFFDRVQSQLTSAVDKVKDAGINVSSRGTATTSARAQDPFASKEDEAGIGGAEQRRASTRPIPGWDPDSRFNLITRGSQVFFAFIGLCIYIALAAFQSRWNVGPSFMSGFGLAVNVIALIAGGVFLSTPLLSDRLRFLRGLERLYRQPRVAVILNGFVVLVLFAAVIASTVSSQSGGCKDASKDEHADLEGYLDNLGGFCRNKRAAAAFLWMTFVAWCASLAVVLYSWYLIRKFPQSSAFSPPRAEQDYDDEAFDARAADGDLTGSGQVRPGASDYTGGRYDDGTEDVPAPGYRPSFGGDSYPYYDDGSDQQQAPRYEAGYRDPFEDDDGVGNHQIQNRVDADRRRRLEAADPYDAIRQSMENHGQSSQGRYL